MIVRPLSLDSDYPILKGFWAEKGLPEVPSEYLPPLGLVAVDERGLLIAGAFLAFCDANLGSIGFISANPDAGRTARDEGLMMVLNGLIDAAKKAGLTMLSAATNVQALQERYVRLGFTKTDENVVHFARRL